MPGHSNWFRPVSIALGAMLLGGIGGVGELRAEPPTVQVYKSPYCDCCGGWVDHMRANGFTVVVQDMDDLTLVKRMAGVPDEQQACHTAVVAGYAVEGHVPAAVVERVLEQKPDIIGIATPGMPTGAPGMGGPPERYDVIAFDKEGSRVFATFVGKVEQ